MSYSYMPLVCLLYTVHVLCQDPLICSTKSTSQVSKVCLVSTSLVVPFQAAQRLVMEERTRTIGEQLDELRRQSENLANTQKMVEDVIKRKRKR